MAGRWPPGSALLDSRNPICDFFAHKSGPYMHTPNPEIPYAPQKLIYLGAPRSEAPREPLLHLALFRRDSSNKRVHMISRIDKLKNIWYNYYRKW